MHWIVGLDLRPRSQGAIHYGAWLNQCAADHRMGGLHVVERPRGAPVGSFDSSALLAEARGECERVLEGAGARSAFDDVDVESGDAAEDQLVSALRVRKADALLLGRRAASGDRSFVRLGRVARRMLRRLPVPTVVVPPELGPGDIGRGPVIALTDLQPDSVAAARFAEQMARDLGRSLALSHTVSPLDHVALYSPTESLSALEAKLEDTATQEMAAWAADNGFGEAMRIVTTGAVTVETSKLAAEHDACLIVCGAHHLSALERILTASMGNELAASSRVPVAVVPPEWPEAPGPKAL